MASCRSKPVSCRGLRHGSGDKRSRAEYRRHENTADKPRHQRGERALKSLSGMTRRICSGFYTKSIDYQSCHFFILSRQKRVPLRRWIMTVVFYKASGFCCGAQYK